jgi:hypothetical protein
MSNEYVHSARLDEASPIDNIELFRQLPDSSLTGWLLKGLEGKGFSPLKIPNEPSPAHQLEVLFSRLGVDEQERLKSATNRAIVEWLPGARSTELLTELVVLAGGIRVSAVIDHVRLILQDLEDQRSTWARRRELVATLIAVVQGFAPLPEVRDLLRRLFYSDKYRPFAAQTFLGLCACKPSEYPEYIPRFLELCRDPSLPFRLEYVWAEFIRLVSLSGFVAQMGRLSKRDWKVLYHMLCSETWSPLRQIFESETGIMIVHRHESQQKERIILAPEWFEDDDAYAVLWSAKDSEILKQGVNQMLAAS